MIRPLSRNKVTAICRGSIDLAGGLSYLVPFLPWWQAVEIRPRPVAIWRRAALLQPLQSPSRNFAGPA